MINQSIGAYRLIEKLGCGGFGCVYAGQNVRLPNSYAAIKLFSGNVESDEECQRFLQEALILDRVHHPHILRILDYGIETVPVGACYPYIITDLALHGSLRDRLRRATHLMPIEQAMTVLSQIAEGLQYAHDHHVVHCDLKPENILFNEYDEVLIADFGIAVVLSSSRTKKGIFAGTAAYMAPEHFHGQVSVKSDQYALACVAYELLTGRLPFPEMDRSRLLYHHMHSIPDAPEKANPALTPLVGTVLLKALDKDPEVRYEQVSDFLLALQRAVLPPFRSQTPVHHPEKPPVQQTKTRLTQARWQAQKWKNSERKWLNRKRGTFRGPFWIKVLILLYPFLATIAVSVITSDLPSALPLLQFILFLAYLVCFSLIRKKRMPGKKRNVDHLSFSSH